MPYSDDEPESGLHCFLCETQCHSKAHNMDTRTTVKQQGMTEIPERPLTLTLLYLSLLSSVTAYTYTSVISACF